MKVLAVHRDDIFNYHAEILKIYVFCHSHDVDLFITRTFVKDNTFVLKSMHLQYLLRYMTLDIFKSMEEPKFLIPKMYHNLLQNLNKNIHILFYVHCTKI